MSNQRTSLSDKYQNRSDKYQWKIQELSCSDDFLNSFSTQDSIGGLLNPFKYSEEEIELKESIKERFRILAEKHMTPRQYIIYTMYSSGMTQMEIAKELKCNQSSIVKCIQGNTDYKTSGKKYGGFIKKMKRVVNEDEIMQELFIKLNELDDNA